MSTQIQNKDQSDQSLEISSRKHERVSPAWTVTFEVLYLARDLYDVIEASPLSESQRIRALEAALLWAKPGPKVVDLAFPEYPVSREWLQRRERTS
jgi:hypothetical protein